MRRQLRMHGLQGVWVVLLMVLGLTVGGYIVAHQNATPPSWMPFVGVDHYRLSARFSSAPGVMPGQGQAVTISGISVGDVAGVRLDRGAAVLDLRIDPQYGDRIHRDATLLLRPKTGLKDMVVELDPGADGPPLPSGSELSTAATEPDVNLDEILASLDGDTRIALASLLSQAGVALRDAGGRALARDLRRLTPLSAHAAQATRLVARRSGQLRRLVRNLSLVADELGRRDDQIATFVRANADVFRRFARQSDDLGRTLQRFPGALRSTTAALRSGGDLATALRSGVPRIRPAARALPTALRELRPFLRATVPSLRDELRPFSREAQPTTRALAPAAARLAGAAPALDRVIQVFVVLTDMLAFDPPGDGATGQSYLFSLPWAAHNTASALNAQDGVGAYRRGLLYLPCGALSFAEDLTKRNPTVGTLLRLLNAPSFDATCAGTPDAKGINR